MQTSHSLPPGPPGFPIAGSALDAIRDPIDMFTRGTQEHGDVVLFRLLELRYVLLNDPDAIRRVLLDNAKGYVKSRNYAGLRVLLGEGLLTSEGDQWRRQRKLAQPAFHREKLASFVDAMVSSTSDLLVRWKSLGNTPFDAHAEMNRLTFRIVGKTLLSKDLEGEASAIGDALGVALKWANEHVESLVRIPPSWPTPANLRMRRAKKTFDDLIYGLIKERRGSAPKNDLLGMLMEAKDAETGAAMSDAHLRDELLTLVVAGHETTANALSFAIYLLSKHPAVFRRVQTEVARALEGRPPTLSDLPKLSYAAMVVEETMRLYPPAWAFERQALERDEVAGYEIPKDAIIGVSPYVLHRNPKLWENPLGFDPDRFTPEQKERRHKFAYLPFGGGPRTCIGNAFAMMEMTIVVAMLAQAVRLDLVPGHELVLDPSVTLRPKTGVWVRVAKEERDAPKRQKLASATA